MRIILRDKSRLILIFFCLLFSCPRQLPAKAGEGKLFSKEAIEYRLKGYKARQNKDYDEAIKYLQKACLLDVYYAAPHNDLGIIYEIKGRAEKAEQEYLKALSIEHNNAEAMMNLALLYESRGLMDKAIPYLQKRIELGPVDSPWVRRARVLLSRYSPTIYEELTKKEEASDLMSQALQEQEAEYKKRLPRTSTTAFPEGTVTSAKKLPQGKTKEPEYIINERLEKYIRLERDIQNPELKNWLLGLPRGMIQILYGEPAEKKISGNWYQDEISGAEWFNAWIHNLPFGTEFSRHIYYQEGSDLVRERWIYKIPAKYRKYASKPQIILTFENDRLTLWEK